MGAHSIGGAFRANSGYAGKWTGIQNQGFSELYYSNMINSSITWKSQVTFLIGNCKNLVLKRFDFGLERSDFKHLHPEMAVFGYFK